MERERGFQKDRRTFLRKAALIAAGTIFASPVVYESVNKVVSVENKRLQQRAKELMFDLENKPILYPENDIPPNLRGFYANMLNTYTLHDKESRETYISDAKELDATRGRISISENYEPVLGVYKPEVLDSVAEFAHELQANGMGLEVDFYDCYTLGNSEVYKSPSYGWQSPTSPYNKTKSVNSYRDFFTDPVLVTSYKERVQSIMEGLSDRGVTNVQAWVPANEPFADIIGKDGKPRLTEWYQNIVPFIQQEDHKMKKKGKIQTETPILAGIARPWDIEYKKINGLTANTAHIYLGYDFPEFSQHLEQTTDPIIIQEFGIAYRYFGIEVPRNMYNVMSLGMVMDVLEKCIFKKHDKKLQDYLLARVSSFAGWKIAPGKDGFSFEEAYTNDIMRELLQSLHVFYKNPEAV